MPSTMSTSDHTERRALVTGAASGIGRATAERLARDGASVVDNYHPDPGPAAEVVRAIESHGGTVVAIAADVSSEEDVEAMFREARAAFGGPIDILVCNAGIEAPHELVDMSLDDWRQVLDVNLTGPFLCARRFARDLIEAGTPGVLAAVTSVHEQIPWPTYSHYCASKGGLKLFMQTIARELAPHRIRAVSVAPGAILTPINAELERDEQKRAETLRQIPWGRFGEPEEIAAAISWLCGNDADYVVGTTLFVDGGMTLYPGVTP